MKEIRTRIWNKIPVINRINSISMKKIQSIFTVVYIMLVVFFSACSIDNYDGPDATITGKVIDEITQQPLITEQPNGFRIEYREISWDPKASLQYFWGKADGTFRNTKIFAGEYQIRPVEGAFVTPELQTAKLSGGGQADLTFTVRPCMSIKNVDIIKSIGTLGDPGVKATFTLQNNVPIQGTTDYRVMVSPNQYTGANIFDPDLSSGAVSFAVGDMNSEISVELYGRGTAKFLPGRKYYVRVAARTNNGSGRYNFSPIVEIEF